MARTDVSLGWWFFTQHAVCNGFSSGSRIAQSWLDSVSDSYSCRPTRYEKGLLLRAYTKLQAQSLRHVEIPEPRQPMKCSLSKSCCSLDVCVSPFTAAGGSSDSSTVVTGGGILNAISRWFRTSAAVI